MYVCMYVCIHELTRSTAQNGNYANPYCAGIEGIIAAYRQSLTVVERWGQCIADMILNCLIGDIGPTNFAPVVNYVTR